ncbi:MAG: hypothetical protein R3Y64_10500 [Peptostreptococcaceae bacterium]
MAKKYEKNEKQIIKVSGKNSFFEIMSDAFPIGKVKINFREYNDSLDKGSRITSQVDIYLPIEKALAVCEMVLNMSLGKKAEQLTKGSKGITTIYEYKGGTMPHVAKREDGHGVSKEFKIQKGQKYMIRAESGPGQVVGTGLISPVPGTSREHQVNVPVDYVQLIEICSLLKVHLQAYLNAEYMNKTYNLIANNEYFNNQNNK